MDFILTTYLYPLKEKIPLSKSLNAYFDNLRTDEEIEDVTEYIRVSEDPNKHGEDWGLCLIAPSRKDAGDVPDGCWVANFEDFLNEFKQHYAHNDFVKKFFSDEEQDTKNDPIRTIAKMIVVVRYNDEGEIERIRGEINEDPENYGILLLDDHHPIIENSNNAISIAHLLSFLTHDFEDAEIESFTLHRYEDASCLRNKYDKALNLALYESSMYFHSLKKQDDSAFINDFEYGFKKLKYWIDKIDNHIQLSGDIELEKILFISDNIKHSEHLEEKSQFLSLVGLIELLLTHNPDFNRFNVEDSINKQFISKISYLLYLNDQKTDLNALKKKLKTIYNQRSNIAHGNFEEYRKYVKSLNKDERFDDLVVDLTKILQIVLRKYFEDSSFMKFLKEN